MARDGTTAAELAGRYLSFVLAQESYGLPIQSVREILGMVDVTPLPRTPPHVRGVVNLRGRIVPVVDLRLRLGVPAAPYDAATCIVVVENGDAESQARIGCIVDTVDDVLDVPASSCRRAPRVARDAGEFVAGLAALEGRVLILLEPDAVLAGILGPPPRVAGRAGP